MSFITRPWKWAAAAALLLAVTACQRVEVGADQKAARQQDAKKEDTKAKAGDWPCFRGPDHSGVSKETGLLKEWPEAGPKLAWQSDKAGQGYAGLAVVKGVVYTMGARGEDEYAIALDAKGGEKWATKLGPVHDWKANSWSHGPNATPAVDGGLVYCLSSKGMLKCLDLDGKEKWKKDLPKDMAGEVNAIGGGIPKFGWGYTWSPVIDGDQLILSVGGNQGLIAALDKKSGEELWRSKDVKVPATYATGTLATIHGVKQFIYVHQKGIVSVSTKDGALLWKHDRDEDYPDVVCATPIVKDDLVYVSVGYSAGQEGYKVTKNGDKLAAKQIYSEQIIGNKQSGTILLGKHVYGYHEDRNWACVEIETGQLVWPKKVTRQKVKAGGMVAADGRFYVLDELGQVSLLEASPKQYKMISTFKLPAESKKRKPRGGIWTYPALSDGKLYVRDQELIFCFEVK